MTFRFNNNNNGNNFPSQKCTRMQDFALQCSYSRARSPKAGALVFYWAEYGLVTTC